jgi:hypothetical protein
MFKAPNLFKFMMWHHDNNNNDGYVKYVVDSNDWACFGWGQSIWEPIKHMVYKFSSITITYHHGLGHYIFFLMLALFILGKNQWKITTLMCIWHLCWRNYLRTLEGGSCLGSNNAKGAVKVHNARLVYVHNPWFAYIWTTFKPSN